MSETVWFVLAALAIVALALAVILPPVWRGLRDGPAAAWRSRLWVVALALALPALAFGMYLLRGDIGAVSEQRSVLSEQLLEQGLPGDTDSAVHVYTELQRHLAKQPDDARALVLKARLDMQAQRYPEAAGAYAKAVAGNNRASRDPGVWVEYAEALGMAQGRTLVGEPMVQVEKALALDAAHAGALDLAGSAAWEMRDFRRAAMYWQRLLEQIPASESRHMELKMAIERAEQRARLSLPPP